MQRTSFKWGQAAKLAAGAALVFAMRELGRGHRSHYVAVSPSFFLSLPIPFCSSIITGSLAGLHISPTFCLRYSHRPETPHLGYPFPRQ
jgi:hypothetical protein